jgi:hypothetical protein
MIMNERFKELSDRLVAVGSPCFGASEHHELHDGITNLQTVVNNLYGSISSATKYARGKVTLSITIEKQQFIDFMEVVNE